MSHKREMVRMLRDNPEWSNRKLVEEYIERHWPDLAKSTLERYARRARWAHEIAEERVEEERAEMHERIEKLREKIDDGQPESEDFPGLPEIIVNEDAPPDQVVVASFDGQGDLVDWGAIVNIGDGPDEE